MAQALAEGRTTPGGVAHARAEQARLAALGRPAALAQLLGLPARTVSKSPGLTARAEPAGRAAQVRIGRYVIERTLGQGGMGAVYAAVDPALGRHVAIKVMLDADDATSGRRFVAEAEAAGRLHHPGIVRVHELGQDGAQRFIVMDLVEGESAQGRLERQGALPSREAVQVVRAVAEALAFAHARGVLHRDVKPHNVLLGPGGPVLTDFGLARDARREALTRTGEGCGTPAFMPPEQVDDMRGVTASADVYGLGATLYALLAGRPPFQGATPLKIVSQVLMHPPAPLRPAAPQVDADLETICLTCLEKDPAHRYADMPALRGIMRQLDREVIAQVSGMTFRDPESQALSLVARAMMHAAAGDAAAALEDLDELSPGLLPPADEAAVERLRREQAELLRRSGPGWESRWARALTAAAAERLRAGARDVAAAALERARSLAPGLADLEPPAPR